MTLTVSSFLKLNEVKDYGDFDFFAESELGYS